MADLQPTVHLRFLERAVDDEADDGTPFKRSERVLQQGWASSYGGLIEWRDVPLVTEADGAALAQPAAPVAVPAQQWEVERARAFVPAGYALVPVAPTPEMLAAASPQAAPAPPQGAQAGAPGPRSLPTRLSCSGCPALKTEDWTEYLENDETDRGTYAICAVAEKNISSYWRDGHPVPGWCPAEPLSAKEAPAPQQALTQAQRIRLWNNSPEYHGDVVGRDAFERLVKLVESVHRIGDLDCPLSMSAMRF